MKAQLVLKSILPTALVLSVLSPAQAADRGDSPTPRTPPEVVKVMDLRLDLASGLIKALDAGLVCDADAYPTTINQEVVTAWDRAGEKQKSSFLKKIAANSIIRKDLAFRIAIKYVDLSKKASPEKFARAITGTQFFTFGSGVFGSRYNVTLGRDGIARQQTMEVLNKAPWFRWHASKTTWSVEPGHSEDSEYFRIRIGDKIYTIDRDTSGEVRLVPPGAKEGTPEYFEQVLSSSNSYCEA